MEVGDGQLEIWVCGFLLASGKLVDLLLQAVDFLACVLQLFVEKGRIAFKGQIQQAVKFLLGLLQLLLQIRLYAFAGLDAMQDAIDLGGNLVGEVRRQILHSFQNCTVQFFFRDGR